VILVVFEITRMVVSMIVNGTGPIVVTWTPGKITPGIGKLTPGKPFLVMVALRNPAEKEARGKVYLTVDGERISEEIVTISPGGATSYRRKVTLKEEKTYQLCCVVEG
jgi:hypothetical protein